MAVTDATNYWYDKLHAVEPTELPFDRPASKLTGRVGLVPIEVQNAFPFLSFADSQEASPLMAALALWGTVLNRFCRQADVLVGVHLNSETGDATEPLPLHLNFATGGPNPLQDLRGALEASKRIISEAERNIVPLSSIMKRLGNEALIRIALCWCEDQSDRRLGSSEGLAEFPLALKLWLSPGPSDSSSLCGECLYDTACFDEVTIRRLADAFQEMAQACSDRASEVYPLVLGEAEIQQQLSWCSTTPDTNLNEEPMMDTRIISHAETNPHGIAISAPDGELTWKQLAEVSELVANAVPNQGMVGLIIEPSTWTAAASLGVWRAGGGYVPMNPDLPSDRLQYIAQTAGLCLILAMKKYAKVAHDIPGIETVLLEDLAASKTKKLEGATPDGCCYMIFTSGSTGKPKGAVLSHRAVLSHVLFCIDDHKITKDDVCKQSASFMFDASVMELWPPLCVGAKVVILKKDGLKDFEYLNDFLRREQVSRVWFVPSAVSEFMQNFSLGSSVSCLLIGGEAVPLKLCADLLSHPDHPNLTLRNIYGPTECSVMSTTTSGKSMDEIPQGGVAYVPIGKPCAWHDCWVLDQYLQPSVSRQGELCILGDGLGDGYANLPDVTAKTFVNTPDWLKQLGVASSSKMYRTGDLVKWLPNGNLDFIGRIDFQVKLRGLRIELGEIENVLREVPNVTEVVVRVKSEQLVAWTSGSYDLAALKKACQSKLPHYMVPTCWIHMDVWPRGGTGKIDTKALPDPEIQEETCEYVAPGTPLEIELCDIFKHVLDVPKDSRVSATQSFFGLGGSSLKAASLMVRLRKAKKTDITFADFYANPSVRALAVFITNKEGQVEKRSLPPMSKAGVSLGEPLVASTNQTQMLTIYEIDPQSCSYNCPFIVSLKGPLNVHALHQAMQHLCEHQPALRTHLGRDAKGRVVQIVVEPKDFVLPFDYWNGLEMLQFSSVRATSDAQLPQRDGSYDDVLAYLRDQGCWPFNVIKGPLIRVVVARASHRSAEEHVLMINQHHAICDGRSISVLFDMLAAAYADATRGLLKSAIPPPATALQYSDFSVWQQSLAKTDMFKEQLKYWTDNLVDLPLLQLPTDFSRPLEQNDDGNLISLTIPASQVARCKAFCAECGSSLYVGLLSLYAFMLSKFARVNDVPIGTAWHGRDCEEIDNMLGYFVNTLVLRCSTDTKSLKDLIERTHKTAMGALSNTLVPYEQALQAAGASKSGVTAFFVFQESLPALSMKDLDASFVDTNVQGKSMFEFLLELREQPDGSVAGDFFLPYAAFSACDRKALRGILP
jgi:amino acid adenylation domain-containing protein